TGFGSEVLKTTTVLPNGGLQAIRGSFRNDGMGGPGPVCTLAPFDDRDDLVFAVANGPSGPRASRPYVFASGDKSDILWENRSIPGLSVWSTHGTSAPSSFSFGGLSDTNWQIVGEADFNGDGLTDLLWQNTSTTELVIWFVNGPSNTKTGAGSLPTTDWCVVGVGSMKAPGNADVLIRNLTTGELKVYVYDSGWFTPSRISL